MVVCMWSIGFLWALIFGLLIPPSGLSASCVSLISIGLLYRKVAPQSLKHQTMTILAAISSLGFFWSSNTLIQWLSLLAVYFCISMLAIASRSTTGFATTAPHYLRQLISWQCSIVMRCLEKDTYIVWKSIWSRQKSTFEKNVKEESRDTNTEPVTMISTAVVSLLFLGVFHALFASINQDYNQFVSEFITVVYQYLLIIIDIELIITTLVNSYVLCAVLRSFEDVKREEELKEYQFAIKALGLLIPVTLLFTVFCYFQSKALFLDLTLLPFHQLSLYTQRGFWELLLAAAIGYGIWLYGESKLDQDNYHKQHLLYLLLLLFTFELLLLAIFSGHKLFFLQSLFGLKDQRVLATLAVALISLTFILCFMKLFHKVNAERIFSLQYLCLLGCISLCSIGNLDYAITKISPLGFYLDSGFVKDYGYLLTNSQDNYTEWNSLIQEAQHTGIDFPRNYYSGNYRPLCIRPRKKSRVNMPLRDLWEKELLLGYMYKFKSSIPKQLTKKGITFSHRAKYPGLNRINAYLTLNYHHYNAYRWLYNNREKVRNFYQYIENHCPYWHGSSDSHISGTRS